jgi:hypothetical protein
MLRQLKRDADGGLTLFIQNKSPGKDKEANWLPAPNGPFSMVLRCYWPKEEAVEGKWTAPSLHSVGERAHPDGLSKPTDFEPFRQFHIS